MAPAWRFEVADRGFPEACVRKWYGKALKNRISVSETMWQPGAGVVRKKIQEREHLETKYRHLGVCNQSTKWRG